ncbi:MAG: hypothetical protein JSV37_06550 [Anaerolineaceae bacterium]|nr:MAG: hypothetical protein JSV37_06550 [Anaerolineaceae bacterium]
MGQKRILGVYILITIFALLGAACDALISSPTATTETPSKASPVYMPTPAVILTPQSQDTPLETEIIVCELDPEAISEMDEIEGQVRSLRGLQQIRPVDREFLTQVQLRQRVIDDFLADFTQEEAFVDARALALLGLLERDFDLWNFYADLFTEQVAGFYDDEVEEMTVICGADFGGPERITFAHEYTHALQDQTYDLENGLGYNDDLCETDSERCAAIQALIEGDATLLEEQWLRTYATREDLTDLMEFLTSFESPVFDSAPQFLRQNMLFPYLAGLEFVNALYFDGGWAAVDAAYLNPPLSTEQILHPERYPTDVPIWLEVPDLSTALSAEWREIDRGVLGEWDIQATLNEFLPKATAVDAAMGWGGDYYLAFYNEVQDIDAFVLVSQWDTMPDVHEFDAAFRDYADARFGDRITTSSYSASWHGEIGYVILERRSNQALWILAPDAETAQALRQAITFPAPQQ